MRAIFIADAHLQKQDEPCYQEMLRFLTGLQGTTDTLYILGDFFEFWIGYPTNPFTHYLPVLEGLRQLHASGTGIVYLEGNHDFHMGTFFTDTLQAAVYTDSATLTIQGRQVHMCHGDQLNPNDIPYRLLRAFFHSRVTKWLTYVLPPWVASAIAERMGRKGRENIHAKGSNTVCQQLLRTYAERQFAAGADLVITGHFHQPFMEEADGEPARLMVSLGDWATLLSYAELSDGAITLKTFS
jgi:UDP-2,3-diacylglucosamine hydrolase